MLRTLVFSPSVFPGHLPGAVPTFHPLLRSQVCESSRDLSRASDSMTTWPLDIYSWVSHGLIKLEQSAEASPSLLQVAPFPG